MMRSSIRQAHFLESILKEGRANKREDLIRHANKDLINAVSELTLNLLKSKLPLQPQHVIRLKPYRKQMRTLANKSLSKRSDVTLYSVNVEADFSKCWGAVYFNSIKG